MARVRLPEWDEFISRVVRQVRFTPDRRGIKRELEAHLEDAAAQRMAGGADARQAAAEAVAGMGDPEEIGRELNCAHNAVIGWTWLISKWTFIVGVVVMGLSGTLFLLPTVLFGSAAPQYTSFDRFYGVGEPVCIVDVDESRELSHRTVTLDEVLIYEGGYVEIRTMTEYPSFSRLPEVWWEASYIRDDTGAEYPVDRFRVNGNYGSGVDYVQFMTRMYTSLEYMNSGEHSPDAVGISEDARTLWIGSEYTGMELEFEVEIGDWGAAA